LKHPCKLFFQKKIDFTHHHLWVVTKWSATKIILKSN